MQVIYASTTQNINKIYGITVSQEVYCFIGINCAPSLKVKYRFFEKQLYGKASVFNFSNTF